MEEFNQDAFRDAFSLFSDSGYKKDEESFKELMNTNIDAFDDMFKLFVQKGYSKTKEEFAKLIGAKVLGETDVVPEKKNPDGTPIIPGGPGSPDSNSNFMAQEEDTESLTEEENQPPLLGTGDVVPDEDVVLDEEENVEDDISNIENDSTFSFDSGDRRRELQGGEVIDFEGNLVDGTERATAIERLFGKNAFTDFFGDMYRAGSVGAAQAGGVDDFMELAHMKAENVTDKQIADYIAASKRLENQPESDEMKEFRRISALNGGGFSGMMVGLMNNFSIAPAVMIQSIRSMVNGYSAAAAGIGAGVGGAVGAKAGGTLGAALTAWSGPGAAFASAVGGLIGGGTGAIAGAIGGATTALETALSFSEFFKEELDKRDLEYNIENVREILEDSEAMGRIKNRAWSRGFTIGALEGVSFGISKGVVTGIAKAGLKSAPKGLLAATRKGSSIQANRLAAAAGGTISEGIGGSAGEFLGRVAADQEMDEIDIFLEGIAGFGAAPISITSGLLAVPSYSINGQRASQADIDALVQKVENGGMTMEELSSSDLNIEIKNDPARNRIITNARSYAKLGLELDPNVQDPADRNTLLNLEYAKTKIKNPDLESSKIKIKRINKFIKAISDKYNGNTKEKALNELQNEGVENPTPEQLNEKADAIFKRETKTLDAQEFTPNSKTLGKRDESEEKTTEQSEQETESQDDITETKKKEVKSEPVTEKQAVKVLKEEGNTNPTATEISNKITELQSEVDLISEQESANEINTDTETEQELKRNEASETETETNDGAKIKVQRESVLDNMGIYQGGKVIGEIAIKALNKVVNTTRLAAQAAKKVLPKIEFVVVEDPAVYDLLVGKREGKSSRGYYNGSNKIFINASKANTTTAMHELGHALIINGLKNATNGNITAVTNRLFKALSNSGVLNKIKVTDVNGKQQTLGKYLEDFSANYDTNLQSEEKIVESLGLIAANFTAFSPKEKSLVRRWVEAIVKKIPGLKKFVKDFTETDAKLVRFLNTLAGKVTSGQEITTEDLSILQEVEQEVGTAKKTKAKKKTKKQPKKKAKKKTKKESEVEVAKKKTKKTSPKKGDIEKANERFRNDYSDPVSGMTFSYDVNSEKFTALEKQGFINREKSIKDFNKKQIVFHSPDSAFSGTIKLRNKQVLVEGKGGLNYPVKFHEDGSFWASTEAGADTLVKLLNDSYVANEGKVLMALTSAPKEKLLSSTTMSNAVLDFFNKGVSKLGRSVIEGGIKAAASFQRETTFIDPKTKKQKTKLSGLNLDIKENESYSSVLKKIRTKLAATNSTFPDRKVFSEELIRYMATEINANLELQKRFTKILGSGVQNKYFKGSPVKGTKGVVKKISFANLKEGLSTMLTAPLLKDLQKSGLVYAIVELNSKVKKVKSDQHESYPFAIKASTKGQKSYLNILTDRVKWSDVALDPSTGNFIAEDNITTIMPTVMGLSTSGLFINTDQVATPGKLTLGQGLDSTQDRFQISMDRLIRDYDVNDRGFMPSNIFNLGLLRRQAKELGLGIQEAKFREGYRRGEVSGYYFTRGFTKAGKPRFYNPRARYQFSEGAAIEQIIEARKANLTEPAIKLYLQNVLQLNTQQIARAMDEADYFADITTIEPSGFVNLGKKEGKLLWKKIVDYVKKENILNTKRTKLSDTEIGIKISEKRVALEKSAKFKTPEQIETELEAYEAKLKKAKRTYTEAELTSKMEQKALQIQTTEIDKRVKVDDSINRFSERERKANLKREAKLTQAQIIDNAVQYLQIQPEYLDLKGKKEGKSDVQNLLVDQLLSGLSTRATVNVSKRMREARQRLEKKFGKNKTLSQSNVFYTQTQLINLIKQTIPSVIFQTKQVQDLLKSVRDIAKPGIEVNQIINSVADQVNTINSKYLFNEVESLLTKTYLTRKSGVVAAKGITNEIRTRIKNILNNTFITENRKLTLEELQEKVTEKNIILQEELNVLESEIAGTEAEIDVLLNKMVDIELAMKVNESIVMEDFNVNKVEILSNVGVNLNQLINEGTTNLKRIKQSNYAASVERASLAYEAITGNKLDMSNAKAVKKAEELLNKAARAKESKAFRLGYLSKIYATVINGLKYLKDGSKGLELLMENIDVLAGTLFGGTMQNLVYEPINESSYAYKQMKIDSFNALMDEAMNIFAPKGKGKLAGKYLLGRKKTATKALRKMNRKVESGNLYNKLSITENMLEGRKDANGNSIYINKAEVTRAINKLKNATGIFAKREAKMELNKVIAEEQIIYSDAETYYLYNQFKDPRNHSNFEAQFGKNYRILMQRLEESMSPELKKWADWQTDTFYPSLYDRYNKVYNKLYHTDLPWNRFYSGRMSYVDVENDGINLTGNVDSAKGKKGKKDVKSVSLFSRVYNDNAIAVMNGNDVLSTYLTDMDWFAAYGENINNISKLFNNKLIKKAIVNTRGESFYGIVKDIIDRIGSRGIRSERSQYLIQKLNTFFIASRIALSPVIFMKQMLSMFTYMSNIGLGKWFLSASKIWANTGTGGLTGKGMVGLSREIFKNSVYLKDRYSAGFQKTLESYAGGKNVKLLSSSFENFAMDLSLFFSKGGDMGAIILGGLPNYALYKEQYLKANPEATSQEVIDFAVKKFQKDTKSTQQSSDIQDKDLFQTGDALMRSFNMFKTTPKQYLRKSWYSQTQLLRKLKSGFRAIMKGQNPITAMREAGKGSFLQNLRNAMMYQFVMPLTFQYVALGLPGLLKPEFDESDEEDMIRAGILGNLGGMFIAGDAISMVADAYQGKFFAGDAKSIAPLELVSMVNKRYMAWEQAEEGTPEKEQALLLFGAALTDMTGLPGTKLNQLRIHQTKIGEGGISSSEELMRYLGYSEFVIKKAFGGTGGNLTRREQIIQENNQNRTKKGGGTNVTRSQQIINENKKRKGRK